MGVFCLIKENNRKITIVVPKELHEIIKADADYEDRSMSKTILRILKKHYNFEIEDD